MSGTANASPRGQRPPGGARRRPAGLVVGDHVGQPGGDAAQAVRRAGMRPALDRSFGYSAGETGLVVEQDPPAGTEVARSAMVTLYVAAPAPGAPVDGPTALGRGEPAVEQQHASATAQAAALASEDAAERTRPRRVATGAAIEADPRDELAIAERIAEEPTEDHHQAPAGLEDPFRREAADPPRMRHAYPRRPIAVTLRSAGKRVWRYRLATLAVLVGAAALAGHAGGSHVSNRTAVAHQTHATPVLPTPPRTQPEERRGTAVGGPAPSHRRRRRLASAARPARARAAAAVVPDSPPPGPADTTQRPAGTGGGPFSP